MILNKSYVLNLIKSKNLTPQGYRLIIYLLSITYLDSKRIENKKIKHMADEINITGSQISETLKLLISNDVINIINNDRYFNLDLFTPNSVLFKPLAIINLIREKNLKPQDYRLMLYLLTITESKTKFISKKKSIEIATELEIHHTQISKNMKILKENEVIYIKNSEKFFNENLFRDDPF